MLEVKTCKKVMLWLFNNRSQGEWTIAHVFEIQAQHNVMYSIWQRIRQNGRRI